MNRQSNLSRIAESADSSMMETISWEPMLMGFCFLSQAMTIAMAYDTTYDPYPFPFSGPATPWATAIDCFITNSRVVTSVPTFIISNPIAPYLRLVSCYGSCEDRFLGACLPARFLATRSVHSAFLPSTFGGLEDLSNSFLELRLHVTIDDRVPNVVA